MTMQPHQIRAARAALGWSQEDLADAAKVHPRTVAIYETSLPPSPDRRARQPCRAKVEGALIASGRIEFTDGQLRIGTTPPS